MNTILNTLIGEAEDLAKLLLTQADELALAIDRETTLKRELKEAEQALSESEAEYIVDAEMQAQAKVGPLAGLAKTSKAYVASCEVLVADARRNGLQSLHERVHALRIETTNAQIAREQHAVRFTALKHAADLRTAILNAVNS